MLLNILILFILITGGYLDSNIDRVCHDVINKYQCNQFAHKLLCGSDGIVYNTECDFAKAHCKKRHLTIVSEGGECRQTEAVTTVSTAVSDNFRRMCQVIVSHYDCSKFQHKILCGSNGMTYNSECSFTKSHCHNPHLSIVSEGTPCGQTTSGIKTTTMTSTAKPIPSTTMQAITSTAKPIPSTTMQAITSTAKPIPSTTIETMMSTSKPIPLTTIETFMSTSKPNPSTTVETMMTTPEPNPSTTVETMMTTPEPNPSTTVETMMTTPEPNPSTTSQSATTIGGSEAVTYVQTAQPVTTSGQTATTTTVVVTAPPTLDPILCQVLLGATCPLTGPKLCGTDSKTYANACEMEKQSCKTPDVRPKSDGECPTSFDLICRAVMEHPCPGESEPVCGSDGSQYNNLCEHQKAKCVDPSLTISHPGPCA